MNRRLWFASVVLVIFSSCASEQPEQPFADTDSGATRVLMISQSEGYRHDVVKRGIGGLSTAEQAITELGISTSLFRVDCSQDCASDFTRERLEQYDIVMFYTTGDLPIAADDLDYFLNDWLRQKGHGFIGVHSATDTFQEHKPYWDMIGGTFLAHPWHADSTVTIKVHDTSHPASQVWGESFVIKDEIYCFKNWQPEKVRVLMSLDMEKTAIKHPIHVPVAWVKEIGDGKMFYTSLGHRDDVWTNPKYLASIEGAVRWILGEEQGDATPNPEKSLEEKQIAERAGG